MVMTKTNTTQHAYQIGTDETLQQLGAHKEGLSADEATKRLSTHGPNKLHEVNRTPRIIKFLLQFKDLMVVLLIICALLSFYLGDMRTGGILLGIVLLNALIGFFQENKAEKIMQSLNALIVTEAKVYRNGELTTIAVSDIVPGDVLALEEGDSVPADGRIIEENELSTNDFALTGESNPSRKFTHAIKGYSQIAGRHNLVFMGTTVATGNARCVVIATGMQTELGRIASLSQSTKTQLSPLQKEMNNLALKITIATILLAVLLAAISMGASVGFKDAVLFAIGIASAMIPQGLPAEVSISLAQATGVLARKRALVKQLSAVETLGSTAIICTDKTGTLTKNEMSVELITLPTKQFTVTGSGYTPSGEIMDSAGNKAEKKADSLLGLLVRTAYFASNAHLNPPDEHHPVWHCIGDPTEGALTTLAMKSGIDITLLDTGSPEIKEFPFDSVRKMMSSIRHYNQQLTVFAKGAPESILAACTHIALPDGSSRPITDQDRQHIEQQNQTLAERAMRNLALAYKPLNETTDYRQHHPEVVENKLIYLGMVSMIDPVREEVPAAMAAAHDAHIKISIITGDSAATARAIAVRAGLAKDPAGITVIAGEELKDLGDEKILEIVSKGGAIFSRVSPEDKLRIVSLVREHHVVAVTGDGINDAPALKAANIGVAMGRTGTDVAKQAAGIVLLDDSFHTLVGAVQQGRTVYQNIKKATIACLTSNYGELFTILISLAALSLFGIPAAITPVLILAVDLIAELFPIAALGWDKGERKLMTDPPRRLKDHIFNTSTFFDLLFTGILIGALAYGNYLLFIDRNNLAIETLAQAALYSSAITLTYVTIVLCQFGNILIRRAQTRTLSRYLFTNKTLWIALGISLACVLSIVYVPFIQHIFGSGPLTLIDWGYAIAAGVIFFVIRESAKLIHSRIASTSRPLDN